MEIKIKKLKPEATFPSYAHLTDAGADLFSCSEITIPAHGRGTVGTGIALEIPDGYAGLVWGKSGLATKKGLTTIAGVIDSEYRGEIIVAIANLSGEDHTFHVGDKVAQLLIQKTEQAVFKETDILSDTERGGSGFGSTGR